MKIGILTFHRAHNYGAVLQCYALQEVLKIMGHDVWVIDYKQSYIDSVYSLLNFTRIVKYLRHGKILSLFNYCVNLPVRYKHKIAYTHFRNKFLNLTNPCSSTTIPNDMDVYVIGSDQLWNTKLTGGIDFVYWGQFSRNPMSSVVAYAVSTNIINLSSIDKQLMSQMLSCFSFISLREYSLAHYIESNQLFTKVEICLDPTLLANFDIWKPFIEKPIKEGKYILIYEARKFAKDPKLLYQKAKQLAEQENCNVIDLSTGNVSPAEFVNFFRFANCVITTSFHAVAFSLIFNRSLYAIALEDGHDERYIGLLHTVGYEDAIVTPNFIPTHINSVPEYIPKRIRELSTLSMDYLIKSLNYAENKHCHTDI